MIAFFIFILGVCVGSFLNVVIDRLGSSDDGWRSLGGRSKCDHCHKQLKALDLIPVVSYILLGGKCRYCKKKVSLYYPLVELLTGVSFVVLFTLVQAPFFLYGVVAALIVIFFADLKYHIIPDEATIALLLFTLLQLSSESVGASVIAGISLMLTIYFIYFATKGRGMGFGDVKLAFAMGLLLGVKPGFLALYIAFVSGGLVGIVLLAMRKKGLKSKLPFGPFLVVGTVVMLFWGRHVVGFFELLF